MQMDMAFIWTIINNNEHMLQMFLKILCGVKVVYDDKLKQKTIERFMYKFKFSLNLNLEKNV